MAEDVLQLPLQFLKGVGPRKAADLKKAGLNTVEDLLFRFPRRYEDRSRLQTIISLRPGMTAAISGEVLNAGLAQTRRPGFRLFQALVQDASGQIQVVWPNQAFLKDVIRAAPAASCCSARSNSGDRADCRSPIPSSRSSRIRDRTGVGSREPGVGSSTRFIPGASCRSTSAPAA